MSLLILSGQTRAVVKNTIDPCKYWQTKPTKSVWTFVWTETTLKLTEILFNFTFHCVTLTFGLSYRNMTSVLWELFFKRALILVAFYQLRKETVTYKKLLPK